MTQRLPARIAGLGLAALLAACANRPGLAQRCPAGAGSPSLVATLFFGRSMPGGRMVGQDDWQRFEQQVIAPALPDGFTVFDASGAWLSPAGHRTQHEPTKVLLVSLPDRPSSLAAVQRVRAAYQAQFHQQLVGMTLGEACADF